MKKLSYLAGHLYGSNVSQLAAVGKRQTGGHVWGEVVQPVAMGMESADAGTLPTQGRGH